MVESSVEGVRKPEPEIYQRALTRLSEAVGRRIEAADCAYLDDLGINLKPARALGFATIKVVDPAARWPSCRSWSASPGRRGVSRAVLAHGCALLTAEQSTTVAGTR